jgi:hypothetical protein
MNRPRRNTAMATNETSEQEPPRSTKERDDSGDDVEGHAAKASQDPAKASQDPARHSKSEDEDEVQGNGVR